MTIAADHGPSPEDFRACDELSCSIHRDYGIVLSDSDRILMPTESIAGLVPFRPDRADTCASAQFLLQELRKSEERTRSWPHFNAPPESTEEKHRKINRSYAFFERYPAIMTLADDDKQREWIHSRLMVDTYMPGMLYEGDSEDVARLAFAQIVHSLDILRQVEQQRFFDEYTEGWCSLLNESVRVAEAYIRRAHVDHLDSSPEIFEAATRALESLPLQLPEYGGVVSRILHPDRDDEQMHGPMSVLMHLMNILPSKPDEDEVTPEYVEKQQDYQAQRRLLTLSLASLAESPEWHDPYSFLEQNASPEGVVEIRCRELHSHDSGISQASDLALSLQSHGYSRWHIVMPEIVKSFVSALSDRGDIRSPRKILDLLNEYLASERHQVTVGLLSYLGISNKKYLSGLTRDVELVDTLFSLKEKNNLHISFLWPEKNEDKSVPVVLTGVRGGSVVIMTRTSFREAQYMVTVPDALPIYLRSSHLFGKHRDDQRFIWEKEIEGAIAEAAEREGWDEKSRVSFTPDALQRCLDEIDVVIKKKIDKKQATELEGYNLQNPASLYVFIRNSSGPDDDGDREYAPEPTGPVVSAGGPTV